MPAPDPALIERFRRDLEALTGETPSPENRLGVAVSGGPDSMALLLLAADAYPGAVVAATFDHGLRPESAREAAMVGELCARIGVPHDTLQLAPCISVTGGNLQERARGARYTALAFWAGSGTLRFERPWRAAWVAVGHHRDDVAEGFLMRARRGSGVGGLAGMRAARPIFAGPAEVPMLVRPLLGWSRAELAAIVAGAGIEPVDDPSNAHPRFDRSRVRALLAATGELPPERLALAANNLRHAEDALAWAAEREWRARHRVEDYETVLLDTSGLPVELRRRLVARAIDHVRFEFDIPGGWRGTGIDRFIATLDEGTAATLAEVKGTPQSGSWRFELAPPRRSH